MCKAKLSTVAPLVGMHAVTGTDTVTGVLADRLWVDEYPFAVFWIVTTVLKREDNVTSHDGTVSKLGTKETKKLLPSDELYCATILLTESRI